MFEELFGPISPAMLLLLIPGFVEFFKQFGIEGKWSALLSLVSGILFGVVLQLGEIYPAAAPWISLVIYSLVFGAAASGYYTLAKRLAITKE